jgi:hypothetical protein
MPCSSAAGGSSSDAAATIVSMATRGPGSANRLVRIEQAVSHDVDPLGWLDAQVPTAASSSEAPRRHHPPPRLLSQHQDLASAAAAPAVGPCGWTPWRATQERRVRRGRSRRRGGTAADGDVETSRLAATSSFGMSIACNWQTAPTAAATSFRPSPGRSCLEVGTFSTWAWPLPPSSVPSCCGGGTRDPRRRRPRSCRLPTSCTACHHGGTCKRRRPIDRTCPTTTPRPSPTLLLPAPSGPWPPKSSSTLWERPTQPF